MNTDNPTVEDVDAKPKRARKAKPAKIEQPVEEQLVDAPDSESLDEPVRRDRRFEASEKRDKEIEDRRRNQPKPEPRVIQSSPPKRNSDRQLAKLLKEQRAGFLNATMTPQMILEMIEKQKERNRKAKEIAKR